MDLIGSRTIAASKDIVWHAILSPEVLKACVPGCTELAGSPEEGFEATVVQKVGPVKATFKGTVTLSNMVFQTSLTLTGAGKGGAAGFAKGGAKVHLETEETTPFYITMLRPKLAASWRNSGLGSSTALQKKWRTSFSKICKRRSKDQQQAKTTKQRKRGGSRSW